MLRLRATDSSDSHLGCARFPEILQNFSECQIFWSLSPVEFHTFTLQLPIQTLHSVAPEHQVFVSSLENCQNEHTLVSQLLTSRWPAWQTTVSSTYLHTSFGKDGV